MNLLNGLEISKIAAAAGSAGTPVNSSVVDLSRKEGVIIFTTILTADGVSNFLKVQASDSSTFASGVVDVEGAKAIPAASNDLVAVDVSKVTLRYVRGVIMRGGTAFATLPIYVAKYGIPKQPAVNAANGAVGTVVKVYNGITPVGVISKPSVTEPDQSDVDIALNVTCTASTYAVTGSTAAHESTQFQIAEIVESVPDWENAVVDLTKTTDLEEMALAGTELENATEYAIRVRYFSTTTGWSDWSGAVTFTTVAGA